MSCIEPTDIGSRYHYSSFVMQNRLKQNLEIRQIDFPLGVLAEAEQFFDFALGSVAGTGTDLLKSNTYYLFFADIYRELNDGVGSANKLDGKLLEFSGLVKSLKEYGSGIIKADRKSYKDLQEFFERLHSKSAQFSSDSALAGMRSPYTY